MNTVESWIWFLLSFTLVVFGSSVLHTGCADLGTQHVVRHSKDAQKSQSEDQGGPVPVLHLPVESGTSVLCTQGVNGSTSHYLESTRFDLDFDTPNNKTEPLFAMISGTVYVHDKAPTNGFGIHVNTDIGNNLYSNHGHLSSVVVKTGEYVVVGQLIGYEGCTGFCTGDHVHVGLHKGDASKPAEYGVSVPVRYHVADKTIGSVFWKLSSDAFICGIKFFGKEGHVYTSALPKFDPKRSIPSTDVHTADAGSTNAPPVSSADASSSNSSSPSSSPETKDAGTTTSVKTSNETVWVNDLDLNGAQDTLMMRDDQWATTKAVGMDSYVFGTGGCFNQTLSESDRMKSFNGYYQVNFSKFSKPCTAEMTLISTLGTDGNPPTKSTNNWHWWQNGSFCSTGSSLCQLQKNNTAWEEWLIRVSWDPVNGLVPLGNGFTKNSQLK